MKALVKSQGENATVQRVLDPAIQQNDDVIVKVAVAGLCRTDVYVALEQVPAANRIILGHEFSGTVVEIGNGVTDLPRGARVAVMPIFQKHTLANLHPIPHDLFTSYDMFGVHLDGCFAEYIRVPRRAIREIPEAMTFHIAAYAEPVAASLAVLQADIHPQQRGVIFGKNRIAELTKRVLHCFGFDQIEMVDEPELIDASPSSFDFAIETGISQESFSAILNLLRPKGMLIVKSRQHQAIRVRLLELLDKEIRLQALAYGSFEQALEILSSGELSVEDLIGKQHSLEGLAKELPHSLHSELAKPFVILS
ncbi:MAG: alcohol dehydrogenase catalytic domain-containing protein [Bdellovibrionales bacterium]|nr:alcohol dehydrogenase catalytic domain-containing protein [Bdellovibrionales bacterium]